MAFLTQLQSMGLTGNLEQDGPRIVAMAAAAGRPLPPEMLEAFGLSGGGDVPGAEFGGHSFQMPPGMAGMFGAQGMQEMMAKLGLTGDMQNDAPILLEFIRATGVEVPREVLDALEGMGGGMAGGMGGGMGGGGGSGPGVFRQAPTASAQTAPTALEGVRSISSEALYTAFVKRRRTGGLVVVFFAATWSEPAKAIAPKVSRMSGLYSDIDVVMVEQDVMNGAQLCMNENVDSFPTFVFVVDGIEVERMTSPAAEQLEAKINTLCENISNGAVPPTPAPAPAKVPKYFDPLALDSENEDDDIYGGEEAPKQTASNPSNGGSDSDDDMYEESEPAPVPGPSPPVAPINGTDGDSDSDMYGESDEEQDEATEPSGSEVVAARVAANASKSGKEKALGKFVKMLGKIMENPEDSKLRRIKSDSSLMADLLGLGSFKELLTAAGFLEFGLSFMLEESGLTEARLVLEALRKALPSKADGAKKKAAGESAAQQAAVEEARKTEEARKKAEEARAAEELCKKAEEAREKAEETAKLKAESDKHQAPAAAAADDDDDDMYGSGSDEEAAKDNLNLKEKRKAVAQLVFEAASKTGKVKAVLKLLQNLEKVKEEPENGKYRRLKQDSTLYVDLKQIYGTCFTLTGGQLGRLRVTFPFVLTGMAELLGMAGFEDYRGTFMLTDDRIPDACAMADALSEAEKKR